MSPKTFEIQDFTLEELLHPRDPVAELYHRKLLKKGWAGKYSPTEKEYRKLSKSHSGDTRNSHSPRVNKAPVLSSP